MATFRYKGKPDKILSEENCDANLWNHVYERGRLRVIQACASVDGRVVTIHHNADGDLHIGLDPDDKSVLNLVNIIHGHRQLVLEIICDHPAQDRSAQSACKDFQSSVVVPSVGDRIRAIGSYVTDRDNGWNEIHPVTRIEILR